MKKYIIKNNADIELKDLQRKIADRVGIGRPTLNKILNGKATTNKAVAWYITYLHLRGQGKWMDDNLLSDYFDEVE